MVDMREKLVELLNRETAKYRFDAWENTDKIADYLIANGVTVKVKKEKPPVDLTGKCGSCVWAVKDTGTFGKSQSYVRCTNGEHLEKRMYFGHSLAAIRQRTTKACKKYVPQPPKGE